MYTLTLGIWFCEALYAEQRFFAAQVPSPLVPKVRNPGDTSQFQEYQEDYSIFSIGAHNVHAKDFEDF
jgi:hypothetical protein